MEVSFLSRDPLATGPQRGQAPDQCTVQQSQHLIKIGKFQLSNKSMIDRCHWCARSQMTSRDSSQHTTSHIGSQNHTDVT